MVPAQLKIEDFLDLVDIMDGKLERMDHKSEDRPMIKQCFKASDKILIEFSKAPQTWETVFEVLQMPDLS